MVARDMQNIFTQAAENATKWCCDVTYIDPCLLSTRLQRIRSGTDRAMLLHPANSTKARGVHGMTNGTVKWFNTTKGYGFIAPDTGGKDIFVHISAVERSGLTGLRDDQKVKFDIESGRDGRESAINLSLA